MTAPRQADRDLGSNPCSVACVCSAFPVCCLSVTNITVYPTTCFHFPFYHESVVQDDLRQPGGGGIARRSECGHAHWLGCKAMHHRGPDSNASKALTPRPPCNTPLMSGRSPHGGGGGSPSDDYPQPQFQCNLKKNFFGAFGAQCFLCFLGQVTPPPLWGGGVWKRGAKSGDPVVSIPKVRSPAPNHREKLIFADHQNGHIGRQLWKQVSRFRSCTLCVQGSAQTWHPKVVEANPRVVLERAFLQEGGQAGQTDAQPVCERVERAWERSWLGRGVGRGRDFRIRIGHPETPDALPVECGHLQTPGRLDPAGRPSHRRSQSSTRAAPRRPSCHEASWYL